MNYRITHNSIDITDKVISFNVKASLGSFNRQVIIDISDKSFYDSIDFGILPENPTLEIFVHDDVSEQSIGQFFIEQPALSIQLHQNSVRGIWGRSIQAKLDKPFAERITKTYDSDITFYAIVDELCTDAGITWSSEIDDFRIFSNTFKVNRQTPIEIIKTLMNKAEGIFTTNSQGHLIISKIKYLPTVHDHIITDSDIQNISESVEIPDFGNRILISAIGSGTGDSINLKTDGNACLPNDGSSRKRLLSRFSKSDGTTENELAVKWSTDAITSTLWKSETFTQNIFFSEQVKSESYLKLNVEWPPSTVFGVYAYSDKNKTVNLAESYTVDGTQITLATALDYCDQTLIVDYESSGIAVNYLIAGTQPEDISVTAQVSSAQQSVNLYIGNDCACPIQLSLFAQPTSINVGSTSRLIAVAEQSGPITVGKLIWMSEAPPTRYGALKWEIGRLGIVSVTHTKTTTINEITGTTQCRCRFYPLTVVGVWADNGEGQPTGPNLYASHVGKIIDLNIVLDSRTNLVADITVIGGVINVFTGNQPGSAEVKAFIESGQEENIEASTTISISRPDKQLPDHSPDNWWPSGEVQDNSIEEPGGDDGDPTRNVGDMADWPEDGEHGCETGNSTPCPDGTVCCWVGLDLGCRPPNECDDGWVSCVPSEGQGQDRFSDICNCDQSCADEFDQYGTTQTYDNGSYRTVQDIVINDYGLVDGSPEYQEKYEELKQEAIDKCMDDCDDCRTADTLGWTADSIPVISPGGTRVMTAEGGVGPYSITFSGTNIIVDLTSEESGIAILTSTSTTGSGVLTLKDKCGTEVVTDIFVGDYYYKDDNWNLGPDGSGDLGWDHKYTYHRTTFRSINNTPIGEATFDCDISDATIDANGPGPYSVKFHCTNPGGRTMCYAVYCRPSTQSSEIEYKNWTFGTVGYHPNGVAYIS